MKKKVLAVLVIVVVVVSAFIIITMNQTSKADNLERTIVEHFGFDYSKYNGSKISREVEGYDHVYWRMTNGTELNQLVDNVREYSQKTIVNVNETTFLTDTFSDHVDDTFRYQNSFYQIDYGSPIGENVYVVRLDCCTP